jgi:hypothetical protein
MMAGALAFFACSLEEGGEGAQGGAAGQAASGGTLAGSAGSSAGKAGAGTGGSGGAGVAGSASGQGGRAGGGAGGTTAGVSGAGGSSGGGAGGVGGSSISGAGGAGTGGGAGNPTGGAGAGMSGAGAGGAGASGAGAGGSGAGTAGSGGKGGPTLPPTDDYSEDGPFETTVDRNVGPGGGYTVFRPEPLGEDGFLHAPIIFGPGIGQSVTVHTSMLTSFASHGFIVVGTPVLDGGPGDAGNRMSMLDGLEWIMAQGNTSGIYQGKIYAGHAISMGFSVGGTSAVEIGGHEDVITVVSIHGHRATAALHGTLLQTTGTQDTVGMPLQQQTYDMSEVPTFLATLTGAPHGYIESNGGGEQRPAIIAWMRYWVYGDTDAEPYFFGDDCVLCTAPWEDPQRKNWQ